LTGLSVIPHFAAMRFKPHALGSALFAALMTCAWLALALADLGRFAAWPCVGAACAAAALVYFLAVRGDADDETSPTQGRILAVLAALGLAGGTLAFTLPPSEMILGGWDPGVYLHTAASVANDGALRIVDEDLAGLDEREREVVSRNLFGVSEPFGGMRVLPDGRTSPEFHHLYPSLLAVV
jgi:hypothetical protein